MSSKPPPGSKNPKIEATLAVAGSAPPYEQGANLAQFSKELADLRDQVAKIGVMVTQTANFHGVDQILINGFEDVCAKLGPLADISPQRVPLNDVGERNGDARLNSLIAATNRPSWSGASSMAIVTESVPFIGAVAPPTDTGSCAS